MITFNKEDIEKVEKFIDIKNKGYLVNSTQLQEVYNRVLDKNLKPTSCGSCLRQRICELEAALKNFKLSLKEEENKTKASDETNGKKDATNKKEVKKNGKA